MSNFVVQGGLSVANQLSATALQQKIILSCYTAGAIYATTSNENPATTFGCGTWSKWGQGRVIVGVNTNDYRFSSAELTGGIENVSHLHDASGGSVVRGPYNGYVTWWGIGETTNKAPNFTYGHCGDWLDSSLPALNHGTAISGNTSSTSTSTIQPYLCVNLWKNTEDPSTFIADYTHALSVDSYTTTGNFYFNNMTQATFNRLFLASHPVNSIYLTINSINPGTLYGGAWQQWGSGRIPMANNSTMNAEGGEYSSSHSHGLATLSAWMGCFNNNAMMFGYNATTASSQASFTYGFRQNNYWTQSQITTLNHNTFLRGDTQDSTTSCIQPYITCYMWRRTA